MELLAVASSVVATAETSPRDVVIPVGHETFYQANLRDKLQNLPANASADGLYLVKQTGNKQELIAYTHPKMSFRQCKPKGLMFSNPSTEC